WCAAARRCLRPGPNPSTKRSEPSEDGVPRLPFPYIGTHMHGALSVVPVPDDKQLNEYTPPVYSNCTCSDAQLTAGPHPVKAAIPTKVGDPSPIKYVIYVIKE